MTFLPWLDYCDPHDCLNTTIGSREELPNHGLGLSFWGSVSQSDYRQSSKVEIR